jgi:hypothetical protein
MATSRSLDTDSLTIRNLYAISTNNIPYSSQTLSVVGPRGLLQWYNPDTWATKIYFSSFNATSLYGLLQNTDPVYLRSNISTVTQGILDAAPYTTVAGVINIVFDQLTTFELSRLPPIIQSYFGGCNSRGTLGYRTYTSSMGSPQTPGSFVTLEENVTESIACFPLTTLLGFSTLVTSNSRLRAEFQNYVYVSTSRIDAPTPFTLSHQLVIRSTGTQICSPVEHRFTGSVKPYTYTSLTWNIPKSVMDTVNVFSSIDYCVVGSAATPFNMYTEITVAASPLFITLDNTYNGTWMYP